jgi:hypothetical protein
VDARFDHHLPGQDGEPVQQARGIVYAALHPYTALAEVFQKTRAIYRWSGEPWLVALDVAQAVPLLDLTGAFPTRAGASMALMTGARSVARRWAQGFYEAFPEVAGLYYPASMHANQPAVALTDRAEGLGVMPERPIFHRALGDAAMLTVLRNAARTLGYKLT